MTLPASKHQRTAVVTGSTRGLGYAIARQLLADGCRVILHGRNSDRLQTALDKLAADGHDPDHLTGRIANLSDRDATEQFAEYLASQQVDVLVNVAGEVDARPYPLLTTPIEAFERSMWVSSWAGLLLARAVLPGMLKRNDDGRIIWTTSTGAQNVMPMSGPSVAAQSLPVQLSLMIEREVTAGSSVTSNVVLVGPTATEGALEATKGIPDKTFEEVIAMLFPNLPGGKPALPDEVAQVYAYLASPRSRTTRGAIVPADKGATSRRFG